LYNLSKVLEKCEDANLIFNCDKCQFMVQEVVILSNKGIEVDKVKVEVIEKLPPPTSLKGVRSFLGHVDFYR